MRQNEDSGKTRYDEQASELWMKIARLDPLDVGRRASAEYKPDKNEFVLKFIEKTFSVQPQTGTVTCLDTRSNADVFLSILILHYLLNAKAHPLTGELLSFKELYGGDVYFTAFSRMILAPLTETFGSDIEAFKEAGTVIGGKPATYGSGAVEITAFPRIPVTLVLWAGDDEVPSSSNILFDSSIREHLPTEDIVVICSMIVSKMRAHGRLK